VRVVALRGGHPPEEIAVGRTDDGGIFGFATPAEIASREIVLQVEADGFNARSIRLDGRPIADDPRATLYASR